MADEHGAVLFDIATPPAGAVVEVAAFGAVVAVGLFLAGGTGPGVETIEGGGVVTVVPVSNGVVVEVVVVDTSENGDVVAVVDEPPAR